MSDTPETDALREAIDSGGAVEAEMTSLAGKLEQERDEARELAYCLYWAAFDLKRFARAYAKGYDEVDGVQGEEKAEEAFYEASRNIAKVLGFEAKREVAK